MGKWETISQIAPGEGDVTRVSVGRSGDGDKEHEHDRDPHFTRPATAEAPSQLKIISYTRCIYVVIILHERIVGVGQTGWQGSRAAVRTEAYIRGLDKTKYKAGPKRAWALMLNKWHPLGPQTKARAE